MRAWVSVSGVLACLCVFAFQCFWLRSVCRALSEVNCPNYLHSVYRPLRFFESAVHPVSHSNPSSW